MDEVRLTVSVPSSLPYDVDVCDHFHVSNVTIPKYEKAESALTGYR